MELTSNPTAHILTISSAVRRYHGGVPGRSAGRRVGYVVSRFPKLSETFVLREMVALEALGWEIELFPLLQGDGAVVHAEAEPWLPRARRVNGQPWELLRSNLAALVRAPGDYLSLWACVLQGYRRSPRALIRALALVPGSVYLAAMVRRDGVPHLHAHFATYPLLAAWVVHRLTGTPYSVTVHAHDLFTGTPMLIRKLADAQFVVAISEYNRNFLVSEVDDNLAGRTAVVHCGVVSELYGPTGPRTAPEGVLDVLCIGSLQEYKGQIHLIEACRLLVDRGQSVRCRIVGEGAWRSVLAGAISAAGLDGIVELLGSRTEREVAVLLRECDVYVQPSVVATDGQMEGIPVSLMEALATGLPVVSSDLSGVPELVRHGETGWLVPPGDPGALADALEEVALRPELALARGAAGRAHVKREFELRDNVGALSELLHPRRTTGREPR